MKKYRVTCYPNGYTIDVEANNVEEAINRAKFIVNDDEFIALPEDVEEIEKVI